MIDVSKVIREKVYASIVAVTTSESSKKNTTFGPFSSEINVMIVSEKIAKKKLQRMIDVSTVIQ